MAINAYLEGYYGYNLSKPQNNRLPSVLQNFTDQNQLNINTRIIGSNFKGNYFRSNISFITGSYAEENIGGEPIFFRNIYEAKFGIKLSKKT